MVEGVQEYMNYLKSVFPIYNNEEFKESIKPFRSNENMDFVWKGGRFDYLVQGDILGEAPFVVLDDTGSKPKFFKAPLFIHSITCDITRDKYIICSPLFSLKYFKEKGFDIKTLTNNMYTPIFYLSGVQINGEDAAIDLSLMFSFPRDVIVNKFNSKELVRFYTLNQLGLYYYLSKMTLHLMRPEDPHTFKCRAV